MRKPAFGDTPGTKEDVYVGLHHCVEVKYLLLIGGRLRSHDQTPG